MNETDLALAKTEKRSLVLKRLANAKDQLDDVSRQRRHIAECDSAFRSGVINNKETMARFFDMTKSDTGSSYVATGLFEEGVATGFSYFRNVDEDMQAQEKLLRRDINNLQESLSDSPSATSHNGKYGRGL